MPSSEAERRCEREGKDKCVIEPVDYQNLTKEKTNGEEQRIVTFMMHQTPNLFLPPQIPYFHNLVSAPRRQPFSTHRRSGDGFDAGDVGGEDEYRV